MWHFCVFAKSSQKSEYPVSTHDNSSPDGNKYRQNYPRLSQTQNLHWLHWFTDGIACLIIVFEKRTWFPTISNLFHGEWHRVLWLIDWPQPFFYAGIHPKSPCKSATGLTISRVASATNDQVPKSLCDLQAPQRCSSDLSGLVSVSTCTSKKTALLQSRGFVHASNNKAALGTVGNCWPLGDSAWCGLHELTSEVLQSHSARMRFQDLRREFVQAAPCWIDWRPICHTPPVIFHNHQQLWRVPKRSLCHVSTRKTSLWGSWHRWSNKLQSLDDGLTSVPNGKYGQNLFWHHGYSLVLSFLKWCSTFRLCNIPTRDGSEWTRTEGELVTVQQHDYPLSPTAAKTLLRKWPAHEWPLGPQHWDLWAMMHWQVPSIPRSSSGIVA